MYPARSARSRSYAADSTGPTCGGGGTRPSACAAPSAPTSALTHSSSKRDSFRPERTPSSSSTSSRSLLEEEPELSVENHRRITAFATGGHAPSPKILATSALDPSGSSPHASRIASIDRSNPSARTRASSCAARSLHASPHDSPARRATAAASSRPAFPQTSIELSVVHRRANSFATSPRVSTVRRFVSPPRAAVVVTNENDARSRAATSRRIASSMDAIAAPTVASRSDARISPIADDESTMPGDASPPGDASRRASRVAASAAAAISYSPRANAASASRIDASARAKASATPAATVSVRSRSDSASSVAARLAIAASSRLVSRPGDATTPNVVMWSSSSGVSSGGSSGERGGARSASAATVATRRSCFSRSAASSASSFDARTRSAPWRISRRSAVASASRRSLACCSASRLSSAPSGTWASGRGIEGRVRCFVRSFGRATTDDDDVRFRRVLRGVSSRIWTHHHGEHAASRRGDLLAA